MVIGVGINLFRAGVLGGDAGVALGVGSALAQILALSPSLLIWPEKGPGWQGTSGGTLSAIGQPVGLLTDLAALEGKTQAEWLASAPELVTNGSYLTDTTGWQVVNTSTITWISPGVVDVATAVNAGAGNLITGLTVGRAYRLTVSVISGTGRVYVNDVNSQSGVEQNFTGLTPGNYEFLFTAEHTSVYIILGSASAAQTIRFGPISVRELPGNLLRAGTWATPSDPARALYGRVPRPGRRNLLTRTEELDNAAWATTRASVSANAIAAPDGTLTADKLVEDSSASTTHLILSGANIPVSDATRYTTTIFAKAAERSWVQLQEGQGVTASAYFDLGTGAVGTVAGTGSPSASIEALSDGWYRCSLTWTSVGTAARVRAYLATGNGGASYTGDGTSGIYIWGAQLEPGSTATAYQKVVTALDVTEAGVADTFYLDPNATATAYSFLNALSARTIIARVRVPTGWTANDRFLTNDAESVNISIASDNWTNTGSGTTRINGASGTAFAVDTWQTLTLEYASAQAFSRLWFSATGSQFGSMDLACLAVFNGALSAGDLATAETIVTATA